MNKSCFALGNNPNSSNTSDPILPCTARPQYADWLTAAFAASIYTLILSVLTLVTTSPLLVVFIKNPMRTFRTPTAYFLAGIATADFVTALVVEPCLYFCHFRMYLKGVYDTFNRVTCSKIFSIAVSTSVVTLNASYFTVLAFTVTQYLAVASPMKMARYITAKSVLIIQAFIWIYCLTFSIVSSLAVRTRLVSEIDVYFHNILVTVLLLIFYTLLFRSFRRKMAHSVQLQSESNRQGSKSQTRRLHLERKFVRINLFLIIVLIITTLPSTILYFVDHAKLSQHLDGETRLIYRLVSECIVLTKFFLDPLVYVWRLPVYRKALHHVCCCGSNLEYGETRLQKGSDLPYTVDQHKRSTVTLYSLQTSTA